MIENKGRSLAERVGFGLWGAFRFCKLQIPRCRECQECRRCRGALPAIARAGFWVPRLEGRTSWTMMRRRHRYRFSCVAPTFAATSWNQLVTTLKAGLVSFADFGNTNRLPSGEMSNGRELLFASYPSVGKSSTAAPVAKPVCESTLTAVSRPEALMNR